MVDNFSILLTHGLMLLAMWRLVHRDDLDVEDPIERDTEPEGFGARAPRLGQRDA